MSNSARIVVTALDALSPLGANAEQGCSAVRAGLASFTEYPLLTCTPSDPDWEERLPMYVASVPAIDIHIDGVDRFVELAMPAVSGVLKQSAISRKDLARTAMLIALPPADTAPSLHAQFLPKLCQRMGLGPKVVRLETAGRTGVFRHLSLAKSLLTAGDVEYCLIGGVDTHLIKENLKQLDEQWRLKSARNVDGLIPGEASAALMLETEEHALARGAAPLAVIGAVGVGREPEPFGSDRVSTAEGLTSAIRQAASSPTFDYPTIDIYCDFNGESEYAFEIGLIMSRLSDIFGKSDGIQHPADCYGDIGAASGAMLTACAITSFSAGKDKANPALLWCAADNGERMAVCVEPYIRQ